MDTNLENVQELAEDFMISEMLICQQDCPNTIMYSMVPKSISKSTPKVHQFRVITLIFKVIPLIFKLISLILN